ncbi:S1 RNA binding domain-containing protein [Desulfotomaculum arcticum]|uniref:S1 RNA binding domain-containing protein n=1 Tax=Desulfotruncus arcticus DSM 17038 TaxID=1121424 RepID=A0A1I2YJW8_9FIRM|nr:S1 RNA-binding domain-containing protein [Desulfotruncus arcticus]SFH25923.1 S1 RNA binding domain-containing protein [Desulfotomaculum arcticum] [Desulfotruncus arcticus DSM 17038]
MQDELCINIETEETKQDTLLVNEPREEGNGSVITTRQPEETKNLNAETTVSKTENTYTHEADDDAWRLIYVALRNNNPLTDYPAMSIEEIADKKCLVIYIPDPLTGVKGILPEKYAGLREREKLESLMNYPFLRVLPVSVDRENNIVILRRDRAEAIHASRAWKNINEGDIVDGVVTGVDRSDNGLANRVYLDIEAIRAILPVGEVSHNYTEDVDYRRGDIIRVKVLKKNEFKNENATSRVLLVSVQDYPGTLRARQYSPGDGHRGKPFGRFCKVYRWGYVPLRQKNFSGYFH